MVDKTQEAKKLQEKFQKKQEEIIKQLRTDLKHISSFSNKKNMDYTKICTISQKIYKNSEALKNMK